MKVAYDQDIAVILCSEEDLQEADNLRNSILEITLNRGKKKLVLDLSIVERINSAAIGAIVSAQVVATIDAGAEVRIAGAHGEVLKVIKMANLDVMLKLEPTRAHAIAALKK